MKMRQLQLKKSLMLGLLLVIFYVVNLVDSTSTDSLTGRVDKNKNKSYRQVIGRLSGARRIKSQSTSTTSTPLTKIPVTSTGQSKNKKSQVETLTENKLVKRRSSDKKVELEQLLHEVSDSRKECKLKKSQSFYCQRVRWSWRVVKELDQNVTKLNDYIQLVKKTPSDNSTQDTPDELLGFEDSWPVVQHVEKFVHKFGGPVDEFLLYKLKKYWNSKELQVTLPQFKSQFKMSPITPHTSLQETGRIFFDPGFNLKMKVPFFRDEMKFAVSTGPSFLAGLGVGMVILGVKSLFSPVMMAVKAMMLSYFMKDMSPFDFFKVLGFGGGGDEVVEEIQNVEVYDPPIVNNPYDNVLDKTAHGSHNHGHVHSHGHKLTSFNSHLPSVGHGHYSGHHHSPPRLNPILQQYASSDLSAPSSYQAYSAPSFNNFHGGGGRDHGRKPFGGPSTSFTSGNNLEQQESINSHQKNPDGSSSSGFKYVPSAALQLEVENYDPFYSPLLSRIDSVFMHLGFTEEGCKERAVCSIYKFPVKYAPYSNLLSAQLSKHQSELKRPVSTSPKILRYFKYMKAAKDGQGALNCTELYPKCTNDTDKLSNLPMVKTFQQLTELMGTGSG